MFGEKWGDEGKRAMLAIEHLPFVGLVEEFSKSLISLEKWLKKNGFENIQLSPVERNVSRNLFQSVEERLEELRQNLGATLFQTLIDANAVDFELYDAVSKRYS
jgi:hypothetical protein